MTRGRDREASLESRVLRLEGSLRRARLALAGLFAVLVLLALVAWRKDDDVRTQRLVLTGDQDSALVVLRAAPSGGGPGLVLETPSGREIMTLGGDAVRPVRR
jgi:hypothetical protein